MTSLAAEHAVRESRRLMAAVTDQQALPSFNGRCGFCGSRCYGKACSAHSDLVLLEQQAMRAV